MADRSTFFSKEREMERLHKQQNKNERKRRKIIRTNQEPMLPIMICGLFWGMIFALSIALTVEIIVTLEGKRAGGIGEFLSRSSYSMVYIWLIFGALTLLLCAIQIIRVYYYGYTEKIYKFADEIQDKEFSEYSPVNSTSIIETAGGENAELVLYEKTAEQPADKKYMEMIKTTIAIGAMVVLYYIISVLLH